MFVSNRSVWGCALCFLLTGTLAAGEMVPRATVGHGPGVLAVQAMGQERWRIADEGSTLPSECSLRTAAAGPCRIHLPDGELVADSDTRLTLKVGRRVVGLEAGRVFVDTKPVRAWPVKVGERLVTVQAGTAVELNIDRDGSRGVRVVRGSVTVAGDGRRLMMLDAGQAVGWLPDEETASQSRELSEDELKRIRRWSDLGERPQGLGQLLVKDSQSGTMDRLNIARYHVNVVLQPPVALIQIDQSFYNPYNRQEEGTFVFNLPQGASVSRFAMYVTPDELVEGELIERKRASDIYQSIVDRKRDPAILEQIGDNLFRMRVFPIFAKDTKRILLDYTLPLKPQHGEYRFRLPLLSDLEPIWDFRLGGVIHGAAPHSSLSSFSHPEVQFQRRGDGSFTFELEKRLFQPEADFHLTLKQRDDAEVRLRSQLAPPLPLADWSANPEWHDPWNGRSTTYFMASIQPERRGEPDLPRPADVLILADTSSGMRGVGHVRESVRTIVHNLVGVDRFRLMAVDVAARPIHEGWVEAESAEADRVLAGFDREFCLGGTNLGRSLQEALRSFSAKVSERRRLVIYVGDGEDATMTSMDSQLSVDDVAWQLKKTQATFVGLVARRSSDGLAILDRLAGATGGLTFDLVGDRSGHRGLFRWLLAGLPSPEKIERLEVDGAEAQDLLFPTSWLPGEALDVLGRLPWTDTVRLKLTTLQEGKAVQRQWELKAENDGSDIFIGRLWAQKKLDRLRREERLPGRMIRERIVGLSQEWSLLSPDTAFLVLETERDYQRWNIDRRVRRRYWKPSDALPRSPLPEDWLARVTPVDSLLRKEAEAKRVARAIAAARDALTTQNYALAHGLLQGVSRLEPAKASEEFLQLDDQVTAEVNRENLLEALGPHRGLFDPTRRRKWTQLEPRLAPLLMRSLGAGAEFLRRHPHARDLLVEVSVQTREGRKDGFNLKEVTDVLAGVTGTNVVVDHRALDAVNFEPDDELDVYGNGKMSLRNYVRFVLSQVDLVMIEEPNRILVTTDERAERRRATRVYPVADLYLENRAPPLEALANPYLDRDQTVAARIWAKLDRPISVDFQETPLAEVVDHLAHVLDDTILIDHLSLEDVNVGPSLPVTAQWKDVPARQALEWILEQSDLDYYVAEEALVITTPEEKEQHLQTQLHSGRGVVFEYPLPTGRPEMARPTMGMSRFAGGMGGFAGGGMGAGGGFGGGMGGMMGGMGAMGGAGGGAAAMGVSPSSGGDVVLGVDPSLTQEAEGPAVAGEDAGDDQPVAETEEAIAATTDTELYEFDTDTVINQVVSTIAPDTWEDVGGPGTLAFFPPTLDFVFRQTDDVHQQVETLFGELRGLATVWSDTEMRPGRIHSVGADNPRTLDIDTLINLVVTVVDPDTWEDVGGPGSIAFDLPRLALVVSTCDETHDRLLRLMTMLRRSRYAALRGASPWEAAVGVVGGAMAGGRVLNALSADLQVDKLPEPEPGEMETLQVRHELGQGLWRWRCTESNGEPGQSLEVRLHGGRMEIVRDEATFRVVDDTAAIAYPDLLLVEHGKWGEAVRQLADVWLPWMPCRSNRELASWFQVEQLERMDEKRPDLVFLRMRPEGSGEEVGTYMEAGFSASDGLAVMWEFYQNGALSSQLRFAGVPGDEAQRGSNNVVLEDTSGKQLAHWELVAWEPQSPAILDLTEGWDGFVQLDRRSERPAVDRAFAESLEAMHRFEWDRAVAALAESENIHPQHPLLQVLTAWCYERRPVFNSRNKILAILRQVAAGRATGLTRFVDQGNFPGLEVEALYDILARQPESTRHSTDLDRLAHAALEAGRLEEALAHTESALALDGRPDDRRFERNRRRVELLLRLGDSDGAVQRLNVWSGEVPRPAEQLATMGEILARYGQATAADGLFTQALGLADLEPERRYKLLVRSANIRRGMGRWKALLEAARLQPAGSALRQQCLGTVLAELDRATHSGIAGTLADATKDPAIRLELHLRQAELTRDRMEASEIVWGIYQSGRMPDGRLSWACQRWNGAGQSKRVIEAVEDRLRSGLALSDDVRAELERAYRSEGRVGDTQRAATSDLETVQGRSPIFTPQ